MFGLGLCSLTSCRPIKSVELTTERDTPLSVQESFLDNTHSSLERYIRYESSPVNSIQFQDQRKTIMKSSLLLSSLYDL